MSTGGSVASSRHAITEARILTAVRRHSRRGNRATTQAVAHHLGMSVEWTALRLAMLAESGQIREAGPDRWVIGG